MLVATLRRRSGSSPISTRLKIDGDGDDNELDGGGQSWWILRVGAKVRARVSSEMQLKMFGDQQHVDFVSSGV
ncbi:hypothetical protein SO802_002955 [Lithocarpus litseifolius]|uniref:DUF7135 domain-containing protein n=1 Tax=Lithocarpus litseifolius TaxID=425828 RepID=A0AAW2E423_9ROSI